MTEPTPDTTAREVSVLDLDRLVDGWHHDPHSILGPHLDAGVVTVRVLRPNAEGITLVTPDGRIPLEHEHRDVWVAAWRSRAVPDYSIDVTYQGSVVPGDDPYRFLPTLGEIDLHLIGEGRHEQLWQVLGAHARSYQTGIGVVSGVSFAVWAPNAQGVRVAGDFNWWDGTAHPMRSLGGTGIWELFVPNIGDGATYKFAILGRDGQWRDKADPFAFATEIPPATGSIVYTSGYSWSDDDWLEVRAQTDQHTRPMSIYEVHLGSWRPGLDYRQLATELSEYVRDAGFTHVEFLPVAEHPFAPSWGYQVTSYFAPTSRFGKPDDLRFLIDSLHQAGIGVLVDWVPAHFPKDEWALARFDGTPLYEHADPRRGEQPDWGTYVFDFGRTEVRNFLVSNALYWLEEYHVDGLRVDAVASMLYLDYSRKDGEWYPNEFGGRENLDAVAFLQELNATVYKRVPGVTMIAEESTAWPGVTRPTFVGGLGFGFKWNMGWMHDSLDYISHEPIHRQYHHNEMTFSMVYAYSEHFILPISHDEVVHGKGSLVARMPGDRWQELANLRAYLAFMWGHPGKKLLFMGSEFAQSGEWSAERGLDWWLLQFPEHSGVLQAVVDLNRVYRESPALWQRDDDPSGFEWIDANDSGSNAFSWVRNGDDGQCIAVMANLSPVPREGYRLGLPRAGTWTEVLNTDAREYGGSGMGNFGAIEAVESPWHGRPASAQIILPPMSTSYFRFEG
ncbi:MAG: 1,4-alpha-glucan branching protein GlgB [Actinomycetota bacterium]|nr:1,4-alpha-glucan branching protein GlgB [Actinomycetota bacterium]